MKERNQILYVDDDAMNRLVFKANTTTFNVLTAPSGEHALEILKNRDDIRVLVADQRMNGMNGIELIRKAKNEYPHLKCLIVTAYPQDIGKLNIKDGLIERCIEKPWEAEDLRSTLADAIGENTLSLKKQSIKLLQQANDALTIANAIGNNMQSFFFKKCGDYND